MKKAKSDYRAGRIRRILLSKQFCITILVVMSLLSVICLIKVILGFLPVKQFVCEGDTYYKVLEISSASGIKEGDKLYRINKSEAKKKILKECPYVKDVKIKAKFPNTVCFVIEEKEPGWYLEFGDEFYSLDYDMELLARETEESKIIKRGLTKLYLPDLEEIIISDNEDKPNVPVFASEDEQVRKETLKIIDTFRTHQIKSRLSKLDVSNRFEIKLEIDNSFEVNFGDMSGFDIKMKALVQVLDEAKNKHKFVGGTLTWTKGTSETAGTFALKGLLPELDAEKIPEGSE